MEMTLIKTRKYNLLPFGKFVIKWKTRQAHIPNIIPCDELTFKHDTSMPMTEEQDKEIVKFMKKAKTDILTDGYALFTRNKFGSNSTLVEVWHKKLSQYKQDPAFKEAVDNGHTWGKIVLNNA
jgi:hypothetical protein